jgi:hypothetical protein
VQNLAEGGRKEPILWDTLELCDELL